MSSRFIRGPEVRTNTTVQTAAGNVTCGNESLVIVKKASGQATTVTLPPSPLTGQRVTVKDGKGDCATNNITVAPSAGTIDGAATYVLSTPYGAVAFDYNGTEWGACALGSGASGAGTPATTTGLTVTEMGDGAQHRTVFTFDAYALATLDNGTAGSGGGAKIYDFPLGYIVIDGCSQNWDLITVDGTGLPGDVEFDIGVGTTVATSAMASLTTTTQDIIPKDDLTMSSSVSAVNINHWSLSTGQFIDGSSTAKDAYLNLAATVATADANGTIVLTGTIVINWHSLGVAAA